VRNSKNRESDVEVIGGEINLSDELDALFKRTLSEFIDARNDLAKRLKRSGRADDANLVKALAKPSVSAWAVNQLHWNHREEFDQMLSTAQRFRQAQASRTAGTSADMRASIEAHSEAVSRLSELAAALLRDAGHNPAADTIHRITTTLEAVSAYASLPDSPTPGRLTRDLGPPGFDSLGSLMLDPGTTKANAEPRAVSPSQESVSAATPASEGASPDGNLERARQLEDPRQARIAAAKALLQDAERSLTEARARAHRLEAEQTRADAEADQAAQELREAEERLKKASAARRDATQRSQSVAAEAKEAAKAVEDAKHNIEEASRELASLELL
jgi:hypothetical protein